MDVAEAAQEPAITGQNRQPICADLAEHPARVAAAGVPQVGVDRLEQVDRVRMPRPPEVVDDGRELGQLGGERGPHSQPS
jgi:hypothetical protein